MPDPVLDAAMRRACDSLMQGDFMAAMADFTPEAVNQAMTMSQGLGEIVTGMPERYEIEGTEEAPGVVRYRVRFALPGRDVHAAATWRLIDGSWKVASISVEGVA